MFSAIFSAGNLEGLDFQTALSQSNFFRIQIIYNSSQSVLKNNLCYSTTTYPVLSLLEE